MICFGNWCIWMDKHSFESFFQYTDRCDTFLQRRVKYRQSTIPLLSCFPSPNSVLGLLSDKLPLLHRYPCWGYYGTNLPSFFSPPLILLFCSRIMSTCVYLFLFSIPWAICLCSMQFYGLNDRNHKGKPETCCSLLFLQRSAVLYSLCQGLLSVNVKKRKLIHISETGKALKRSNSVPVLPNNQQIKDGLIN